MSIDVEVLIVSYGSAAAVERCLASIARAMPGASVAIREHSDDPGARRHIGEVAMSHAVQVRLDFDPSNPGFGAGCNALAASSAAEWLVFLNPDAEVVAWPWSAASPPPRGIIVGAQVDGPGGPGGHFGRRYRVLDEIARSWLRRRGQPPDGAGFVSGAAMLVDAHTFGAIGGFDSEYFLFYEDIDLCWRANRQGYGTYVAHGWVVMHSGGHSTRQQFGRAITWSYESACRFHASQGSSLAGYRIYVVADSLARWALHALRRTAGERAAYARLARRAASDLLRRAPAASRSS